MISINQSVSADNKSSVTIGKWYIAEEVSVMIIPLATSKLILQESLVRLVFSII